MFKSIGAVLAGFVTSIALALLTDFVVESTRLLPSGPLHDVRQGFIELGYRCLFTILAGFITARLAPSRPMLHTAILGGVSLLITVAGSVATWNMGLAPAWFTVTLIVLVLPATLLGGWLHMSLLTKAALPGSQGGGAPAEL